MKSRNPLIALGLRRVAAGIVLVCGAILRPAPGHAQDCIDYGNILRQVGEVGAGGNRVVVSGTYAYVAAGWGLIVVDISNPSSPIVTGSQPLPGNGKGVAVAGNYAYFADGLSGLFVIDISNPSLPFTVGGYNHPARPSTWL